MLTAIKCRFEGKQFPSVRRIFLPFSAHEIIKGCPNVEEVTCTEGNGSTIVGSLIKGNCQRVRVLKGISIPLTRLVKLLSNLKHIGVAMSGDMKTLISFPVLETVEIVVPCGFGQDQELPLKEIAALDVKEVKQLAS